MNPNGPWNGMPDPGQPGSTFIHHDSVWTGALHLLPLLLLAVMIGVVVWAATNSGSVTLAGRSIAPTTSSEAPTWVGRRSRMLRPTEPTPGSRLQTRSEHDRIDGGAGCAGAGGRARRPVAFLV